MFNLHAQSALTFDGWQKDVRITVASGRIVSMDCNVQPMIGDERVGVLIPGMPNVHSHAFQRGMAGLAEMRGPVEDNFWSWRTVMYRFALTMSPDDVESIASQLYMEMLEAGFCRVGEFHYLHHDRDGRAYGNIAEMASRIAAAAEITGIGLTLLPVFYAHSTFGGAQPHDGQRRFISTLDCFQEIVSAARVIVKKVPGANVGVAPHSLRAVTPEELTAIIAMTTTEPIHIHAADQIKEVQDCIAWCGAAPVQWLLDHAEINFRWCLIHSTHMTNDETRRLARSGATAGLCPITEANLGDGIFPAVEYLADGGTFAIGTDSNIQIGVDTELRQLEYAQRLRLQMRNVIAPPHRSTGRSLFDHALRGGAAALQNCNGLHPGHPANFLSLMTAGVPQLQEDLLLDSWIFTGAIRPDCVWVNGQKVVVDGIHIQRESINARFLQTMRKLASAM